MVNILIPMGGRGQRFKNAGYTTTKPLIDVNGLPMIQRVIENLDIIGRYIFLISTEDYYQYNLSKMLTTFCNISECKIILEDPNTRRGAAAACLLAKNLINTNEDLIIANSDQLVDWSSSKFLSDMKDKNADGGILTFTSTESKWSFAKVKDGTNAVIEVAEKNPISDKATAGIYWFKHGSDFINGVEQMIAKDIRVNGEFYVCPVFNELINSGKIIIDYPIKSMIGLGTPEDLEMYLKRL